MQSHFGTALLEAPGIRFSPCMVEAQAVFFWSRCRSRLRSRVHDATHPTRKHPTQKLLLERTRLPSVFAVKKLLFLVFRFFVVFFWTVVVLCRVHFQQYVVRARARSFPLEICLAIELFVYCMGAVPSAEWTVRGRPGYRVASFRFSGLRHGHRTVAEHDKQSSATQRLAWGCLRRASWSGHC